MADDGVIASRVSTVEASFMSPMPEKRTRLQQVKDGLFDVVKTIWQVPAAQSFIATLLVRYGFPGTLVAIGMAVGDKLAQ